MNRNNTRRPPKGRRRISLQLAFTFALFINFIVFALIYNQALEVEIRYACDNDGADGSTGGGSEKNGMSVGQSDKEEAPFVIQLDESKEVEKGEDDADADAVGHSIPTLVNDAKDDVTIESDVKNIAESSTTETKDEKEADDGKKESKTSKTEKESTNTKEEKTETAVTQPKKNEVKSQEQKQKDDGDDDDDSGKKESNTSKTEKESTSTKEEKTENEVTSQEQEPHPNYHSYTICNGISNQILIHAANIATSIKQKREGVNIPNAFIVDGTQHKNRRGVLQDVVPTPENMVKLSSIYDIDNLVNSLESKYGIKIRLVEPNFKVQKCKNWLETLKQGDDHVLNEIITQFKPSEYSTKHVDEIMKPLLQDGRNLDNGVCLHHRGGDDWLEHCKIWTRIGDGVWRRNCNTDRNRALWKTIVPRIKEGQWIYYVGDFDDIPPELKERFMVTSKEELLGVDVFTNPEHPFYGAGRDMKALVDTLVCNKLPFFIGNSVSTWSAIQLAQRRTQSSWYNSRSVPLSQLWKVYEIPIVYTYTEESSAEVKLLLKASIRSVKLKMPANPFQIIYHKNDGNEDKEFQDWLHQNGVLVYYHTPSWRNTIEEMRLKAIDAKSSLDEKMLPTIQHSGDFFGTWQRIDIPNHIFSEYCLFMSHDTVVKETFTIIDFGLQIVPSLAFTSYSDQHEMRPKDAGILLMNIPTMRETFQEFGKFLVRDHKDGSFSIPYTVEGSLIDFYKPKFLDRKWSYKAHWDTKHWHKMMILSFRDMSPLDVVDYHIFRKEDVCTGGKAAALCERNSSSEEMPFLCASLQIFAKAAKEEAGLIGDLCQERFGNEDGKSKVPICEGFFDKIAKMPYMKGGVSCESIVKEVQDSHTATKL